MNFKNFYKKRLFESDNLQYPLWYDMDSIDESTRLIYYVPIEARGRIGSIQRFEPHTKVYGAVFDIINGGDAMDYWVVKRSITSFEDMIVQAKTYMEKFCTGLRQEWPDDAGTDEQDLTFIYAFEEFKETIEPLHNVKGEWYIVGKDDDDAVDLYICIEVEKSVIRAYNINKDLENVDKTGLEDLL